MKSHRKASELVHTFYMFMMETRLFVKIRANHSIKPAITYTQ